MPVRGVPRSPALSLLPTTGGEFPGRDPRRLGLALARAREPGTPLASVGFARSAAPLVAGMRIPAAGLALPRDGRTRSTMRAVSLWMPLVSPRRVMLPAMMLARGLGTGAFAARAIAARVLRAGLVPARMIAARMIAARMVAARVLAARVGGGAARRRLRAALATATRCRGRAGAGGPGAALFTRRAGRRLPRRTAPGALPGLGSA